ncbi:MAG: phosphotransferase family protein [Acidimicrobiales bacterium]
MTGAADDDIAARVRAFVEAGLPGASDVRIAGLTRAPVGRSRENWVFDASWRQDGVAHAEALIARRDPPGGLLETDRAVEFAVLRALEGTAIPAPRARWLDPTGEALGRPSLVMRREEGVCDYFVLNGERPLADRVALARRLCDLLVRIHQLDWRAAGLGEVLADPGPDAARVELAAWEAVVRRDQLEAQPELEAIAGWLSRHAPASARTVLVHADFKAGNLLLDGDEIVVLLDWELAHLGDAMEDLGWITQPLRRREHLIPGAWERAELFAHYEAAAGVAVDEAAVHWWNVLACYKTAAMQLSGLGSFVEGRSDELYRPTVTLLRTAFDLIGW